MKQTTKRFFGTAVVVAMVSGLTASYATKIMNDKMDVMDGDPNVEMSEPKLMTMSATHATPGQPVDLTDAAEKGCNAVVYIKVIMGGKIQTVEYRDPFEDFFGDFFGRGGGTQRRQVQTPKREAAGSGVIISTDGYIVTNNHVVEDANEITVTLNDNREFSARVIGTDPDTDLALIKVDAKGLPTLVIGDSDALKVGEWVLAVGNPFNLTSTVTAGIVSAKARSMGKNRTGIESFIQTDAAINQGNSGGALVNARGELVGINAMLYSNTGSYTGYGFAIPTSIMKKVVADLKEYGTVQRALFGVSGVTLHDYVSSKKSEDSNYKADFGTVDGVYIAGVSADGAAAEAGIKEGDVIIAVDGKKITKMSELQESTTQYHPGDKAVVTYMRDKKEKKATVTFRNAKGTTAVVKATDVTVLGAEFAELSESLKKTLNLAYGVQVKSVKANGKFAEAGVPKDFIILKINNQNIKSNADLDAVFKAAKNSAEQTMWIWGKTPAGRNMSFAISLED